jgi:bifunctional non-homologous end joining protein LigD
MPLAEYRRKRNFDRTAEPRGRVRSQRGRLTFVVQKHAASHLHYDFRLELDGVLKSWAVPKGPSLDPAVKSLAVQVEDHPLDYGSFEGTIPQGEYGGGTVLLWDRGTWSPEEDPRDGLQRGSLKFELQGEKLTGSWSLVRMNSKGDRKNWLLIKHKDESARPGDGHGLEDRLPRSVQSGRDLDEVSAANDRVWKSHRSKASSNRKKPKRQRKSQPKRRRTRQPSLDLDGMRRGRQASLPLVLQPPLATATSTVPEGDQWLHELKFDGYRILSHVNGGEVQLISRTGKDWTERFRPIAGAVQELGLSDTILDGEVVVLNEHGISDFQALQNRLQEGRPEDLVYYVFDAPFAQGYDLRETPLLERKQALSSLLESSGAGNSGAIRYSDHILGNGRETLAEGCRRELEGIVSKEVSSRYVSGRTRTWLKSKCLGRQEFVIGGYTRPSGTRKHLGALLLGYHDGPQLVYCGRVGTGFTAASLRELGAKLRKLKTEECPFRPRPQDVPRREVIWVRPALVAEVEFAEWTRDGRLRHPSFHGLREDKPAADVVREVGARLPRRSSRTAAREETMAKPRRRVSHVPSRSGEDGRVAGIEITHPGRIVDLESGLTKSAIAEYYAAVADWILPHVVERPLTIVRCPDGRRATCFYQKHWTPHLPEAIDRVPIEEKEGTRDYILIHDVEGLVSLVQFGVLELHPWGSRGDKLERPDRLIFDLDPDDAVPWGDVIQAAHDVRDLLDEWGLQTFVQVSGGKGVHVVAPLVRRSSWDDLLEFTQSVAQGFAAHQSELYVANMRKALRRGKIYIDYLRNRREATAIAPYSTRNRPGVPVATPLTWKELAGTTAANTFTVPDVLRRVASLSDDPWEGFHSPTQSLTRERLREAARFAKR